MKVLEARASAESEAAGKAADQAESQAKAQHNFTDPESRIMKSTDGFVQAYNAQIAVEPNFQLIVGQAVTQAGNDVQQVVPMMKAVEEQSGRRPTELLADSGYVRTAICKIWRRAGKADRSLHCDGSAEARREDEEPARAGAGEGEPGGTNDAEVADQSGSCDIRGAQSNCGASVRAN